MTTYELLINPRDANEIRMTEDSQDIEDIKISNSKQSSIQNASFKIYDRAGTYHDNIDISYDIEILINGVVEFEGFISALDIKYEGMYVFDIQCTGNTFDLERYITPMALTFMGEKTGYIAKTLIEDYTVAMDSKHMSTSDGVTVDTITFNGETINSCFKRLTQLDGYDYYVGQGRTV